MHEASLHERNCFITLTYDDEHLPKGGTLVKSHFQDFMKSFRHAISPMRVSYFMCGEYGDLNGRPHYHAIIFGYDFSGDRLLRRRWTAVPSRADLVKAPKACYSSSELAKYWKLGHNAVGPVTPQSAGYVARYCLKKVTGVQADEHYRRVDPDTGEVYWLLPEYANMSTRPAIGKAWFDRFSGDVIAYDGVHIDGKQGTPPRYYDKLRKREDAMQLRRAKLKRKVKSIRRAADNSPGRLAVREEVAKARLKSLQQRKL